MGSGGKTVGYIAMGAGVVICLAVFAFLGSGMASGSLTASGAILGGILFGVLPLLLLGGFGVFMLVKGRSEEAEMANVKQQERLLGMIQARGQVQLAQVMIELKMTREEVRNNIYELVNLGLFSGYIDWGKQMFYSQDAGKVESNTCPNCGGVRELVGKGVVQCPYCGVDLFISKDAPQTTAAPVSPPSPS
ncbi:MAG: hypothetical protein HC893_15570 [Chloroflexaceae bacterium]|nr:hypothetical protein [Chloroflexaceae bacterium]NJL35003.1 hypothetical protein [Chloroflexaceae bacterium]NJO06946.1 hypothetical protein [Chloroflexaceae bacterium]